MIVPSKDIAAFASHIVNLCYASRKDRIQRGTLYRNMYLTGDENGNAQTYQKSNEYIETISSYIYSPVELRFGVEFYGSASPVSRGMGKSATQELHKHVRRSGLDTKTGEAVTWALVKGKTFLKIGWSGGFEPYLIQPEMMGVLEENIDNLDAQQAFVHSTFYTPDRFQALVWNYPNRDKILKNVKKYITPGSIGDATANNNLKEIVLGSLYPYQAATQGGSQTRGFVNWLGGPAPYLAPEVSKTLIRLDELWVWDDNREDWTTIQIVGDDIVLAGEATHRNLFADALDPDDTQKSQPWYGGNPLKGKHPFVEICPNPLDGYFWGRSELCNVGLLQISINRRINGINSLLRQQEDPPRMFTGSTGVNQQAYSKMKKPGGYLVDSNPNAKVTTLAPELPTGLWDSLYELKNMFNEMGSLSPVLQGRGDAGVRSQGQAETLIRTSAPRFKDRALRVERQVEALGGLCLDILKAKVGTKQTAWLMPKDVKKSMMAQLLAKFSKEDTLDEAPIAGMEPVDFLFAQLPDNLKVVVDSHSSSPAFSMDTENLLFNLFKAGAVDRKRLVQHTHPPGQEEIIDDLDMAQISEENFAQENPIAFAEMQKKKK